MTLMESIAKIAIPVGIAGTLGFLLFSALPPLEPIEPKPVYAEIVSMVVE